MTQIVVSALFAGSLFFGVLICIRLGWWFGRKRLAQQGESGNAGLGAVEGAIFGLVGLLIAFTFTGAASRFDQRRQLITQQVNAIGTAWLRLDLLDDQAQAAVRELFRRYVETQVELGANAADPQVAGELFARHTALQDQIWARVVTAARNDKAQPLTMALLPPVNEMFDLAGSRQLATRQHPPLAIYLMLGLLVLVSALMAGFGMAKAQRQSRLHLFGFAAIMALSIYLILDLEFPRLGLVRINNFDQALIELRASMK